MRRNIALYINGQQADLENDSIIQFNYTMEDLTDPAIVKNSYSQQVTLPSTPRNNKIFGHIANADRATSTGFNALMRTPFVITEDGNIIESGYLKLDSIQRKGASLAYTVSLYGGLGSFFYNLSYTEDGQSLTLADLDYMQGEKLDFRIYKTAVTQAWEELASGKAYDNASRWQIINFAPAYNGIPSDDFDADKALCDPALTVYPPSYLDEDGEEWVASNFVEMSREYNEWQVKDLRSYMQRPVMRMRAVIEACCDAAQNGGYTVTLDPTFFNDDNPYYDKVWFSLPILRTLELSSMNGDDEVSYGGGFSSAYNSVTMRLRNNTNIEGANANILINVLQSISSTPNRDLADGEEIILGYKDGSAVITAEITYTLRALDINGNVIFTTTGTNACRYQWTQAKGVGSGCQLSISNMTNVAAIELVAELGNYESELAVYDKSNNVVASDYYLSFLPSGENTISYTSSELARSGSLITQDALLRTKNTPADYLLSYCKTFGLHFLYDKANKAISIVSRNTLYGVGQTVDINAKIDRSQPITITPYVLDSKWYDFAHTNEEGDFAKYYKTIYGTQYGAQVVNTGFDFNAEHKEVLSSVLFQGACQVSERSKYYNIISHPHSQEVLEGSDDVLYDAEAELIYVRGGRRYYPSILLDASHRGQYVDKEGNTQEKIIATVPSIAEIEYYDPTYKSYDSYSKVQFHNNEDEPIELRDVLMFYDGMADANVTVTDDTAKMLSDNEGTPCWILTVPTEPIQIARFVRFNDSHSLDLGTPREIDIPNASYPSSGTIYTRGWQAYIADRYDVDTKVVKCFVDLRGVQVNENLLRNFYVFDNALWVLNKITNYTMTSYTTTECEFVKVKDKNSYTNGQKYN